MNNVADIKKRHKHAAFSAAIAEAFRRLKPGQTITYEEMADAAGVDVEYLKENRQIYGKARHDVRRHDGIVIKVEQGVGQVRATGDAFAAIGDRARAAARRKASRAIEELCHADVEKMSNDARASMIASRAQLGVIASAAAGRLARELRDVAKANPDMVSDGEAIRRIRMLKPQSA